MPAKGKKKTSDADRRKIALAKVAGASTAEIARSMDLAPRSVSRIVADRRTQTQILDLKRASEQDFARMWIDMVKKLEKDLNSKNFNVRATSRVHFLRILTAGDPPLHRVGDQDGVGGDYTLEELVS